MAHNTLTIRVEPGSELNRLLDEADHKKVVLERNGTRYWLTRDTEIVAVDEADIWATYDPEAVGTAIHEFAGILSDEEAREMKERIYRAREEGTRPVDRP